MAATCRCVHVPIRCRGARLASSQWRPEDGCEPSLPGAVHHGAAAGGPFLAMGWRSVLRSAVGAERAPLDQRIRDLSLLAVLSALGAAIGQSGAIAAIAVPVT